MDDRKKIISDAFDTLMGVTKVTLYAAFSEQGDIWPTTIRRTLADAVAALKQETNIDPAHPFEGGVRMGCFVFKGSPVTGWNFRLPADAQVTWIPLNEVPQFDGATNP